ncbi:MAG: hypothetical protein RDV41_10350 [Planctomycetota bacterium]|nr:hypothetical protein [Planctomycetota bacterium]
MEIIIDGLKDLASPEQGATLGVIVDQLRSWLGRNERAIMKLEVDGRVLDEKAIEEGRREAVSKHKTMNVTTISVLELAVTTLSQVLDQCPNLSKGFKTVAEKIHQGSLTAGHKTLSDCVEAMQLMMSSIQDVGHLVRFDYDQMKLDGTSVSNILSALRKDVVDLRAALERKDVVTVADLAEHDLSDGVGKVAGVLKKLMDETIKKAKAGEQKP